jgi:hypothetical protein
MSASPAAGAWRSPGWRRAEQCQYGTLHPDYTAYEELLSVFKAFIPSRSCWNPSGLPDIDAGVEERDPRRPQRLLVSNPATRPASSSKPGAGGLGELARDCRCSLIIDDLLALYLYAWHGQRKIVSVAITSRTSKQTDHHRRWLTKNWRYPAGASADAESPGIDAIASAGSFLDGRANHPLQTVAIPLLDPHTTRQETVAIQRHFCEKREYALKRLRRMGIGVDAEPSGGFYVWANLSNLPEPLNDGMSFFRAGLKEKVITVPGIFFDVNPDSRRVYARYQNYCRISFGPEMKKLEIGLDAIERVIGKV